MTLDLTNLDTRPGKYAGCKKHKGDCYDVFAIATGETLTPDFPEQAPIYYSVCLPTWLHVTAKPADSNPGALSKFINDYTPVVDEEEQEFRRDLAVVVAEAERRHP